MASEGLKVRRALEAVMGGFLGRARLWVWQGIVKRQREAVAVFGVAAYLISARGGSDAG